MKNIKLTEDKLNNMISESVIKVLNEADKMRFSQLMHFVSQNITKALVNYADNKEESGEPYTKEDLIRVAEKVFKHYNKKYPSIPQDTTVRVVDYFIEKNKNKRDFLVLESKKVVKLNEDKLRNMIAESVKKIMKEGFPGYDKWKTSVPDSLNEPDMIDKDDFMDMVKQYTMSSKYYRKDCEDFLEWMEEYEPEVYESVVEKMNSGESSDNPFFVAMECGLDWGEISRDYFDMKPSNYYPNDRENEI